jgi:hypothetical protein
MSLVIWQICNHFKLATFSTESPHYDQIAALRQPTFSAKKRLTHRSKHHACSITARFPADERQSSRTAGQKSATKFSIAENVKPRQNDNNLASF